MASNNLLDPATYATTPNGATAEKVETVSREIAAIRRRGGGGGGGGVSSLLGDVIGNPASNTINTTAAPQMLRVGLGTPADSVYGLKVETGPVSLAYEGATHIDPAGAYTGDFLLRRTSSLNTGAFQRRLSHTYLTARGTGQVGGGGWMNVQSRVEDDAGVQEHTVLTTSAATPVVVTTVTSHSFIVGERVVLYNVTGGDGSINNVWVVQAVDYTAKTVTLQSSTSVAGGGGGGKIRNAPSMYAMSAVVMPRIIRNAGTGNALNADDVVGLGVFNTGPGRGTDGIWIDGSTDGTQGLSDWATWIGGNASCERAMAFGGGAIGQDNWFAGGPSGLHLTTPAVATNSRMIRFPLASNIAAHGIAFRSDLDVYGLTTNTLRVEGSTAGTLARVRIEHTAATHTGADLIVFGKDALGTAITGIFRSDYSLLGTGTAGLGIGTTTDHRVRFYADNRAMMDLRENGRIVADFSPEATTDDSGGAIVFTPSAAWDDAGLGNPHIRLNISPNSFSGGYNGTRGDAITSDTANTSGYSRWLCYYSETTFDQKGSFAPFKARTTVDEVASGNDLYHEVSQYQGDLIMQSRGALGQVAEFPITIAASKQARASAHVLIVKENNTYASYNNSAIFGATSPWLDSGSIGLRMIAGGIHRAGTGILITSGGGTGQGWTRALVVQDNSGNDILCFDSVNTRLGIGTGVTTNNTTASTIPAALTLAATAGTGTAGIQLGTANWIRMWRGANDRMTFTPSATAAPNFDFQSVGDASPFITMGNSAANHSLRVRLQNSSGGASWFIAAAAGGFLTGTSAGDSGFFNATTGKSFHLGGTTSTVEVTADNKLGFYNIATPVAQGAAVANATSSVDVILRFNELVARIRATGLIAT